MRLSSSLYRYFLFLILLALPPAILSLTGNGYYLVTRFWLLLGYISILTLLVVIPVRIIQKKNTEQYAQAFLAGTTVKILACLFFVVFFLKKIPVNRLVFVIDFCYIYFLNTAFEVYDLLRNLRNQNLR